VRAVRKSSKLYLWDWSEVPTEGARFENLVAGHLLKFCHFLEDTQGFKMELRFLRDTDLREIDFVVLKDRKPLFAVECKTGEAQISPHIYYFRSRTQIPKFYQVHLGQKNFQDGNIHLLPFVDFCRIEKLV
jgi:predicted AAA+ superfamily ATPase